MNAGDAIQQLYRAGQRAWPDIELAPTIFEAHCSKMATSSGNHFDIELERGPDLYLCCAAAARDARAVQVLEREVLGVAKTAIARVNRDREFVDETVQELWDKLLSGTPPKLGEFAGRGPLKAWIRVVSARLALDRCRYQRVLAGRQIELSDGLSGERLSPELSSMRSLYAADFQSALRRALAALSPQARNVLRMHVVGQCGIDEIGRAYNVHRATAARWLERARQQIYDSVRRELSMAHGSLTDSEFKSLARDMGSELELSFGEDSARSGLNASDPFS